MGGETLAPRHPYAPVVLRQVDSHRGAVVGVLWKCFGLHLHGRRPHLHVFARTNWERGVRWGSC